MDIITRLNKIKMLIEEIEILENAYKREYDIVTRATQGYKYLTGTGNTTDHKYDNLAHCAELLQQKHRELTAEKAEAEKELQKLNDARYISILRLRYLDGLQWRDIMKITNYSKSGCFRLHNEALNILKSTA